MNVPAHLIFGTAAFAKPGNRAVTIGAVLGSFVPDMSLFVMAGWSLYISGIAPGVVFGEYYFSDTWQRVFAVDNSFIFWGMALGLALWLRRAAVAAFAMAGLLHLLFDFVLHNADARIQFWPLTDWKFISPLSYWDGRFYAGIISPLEVWVSLLLAGLLLLRFRGWAARGLIATAALAEVLSTGAFGLLFLH